MEAARLASLEDLPAVRWIAEEIVAEQLPARGGELFHRHEAVSLVDDLEAAIPEQRLVVGTYDDVVLGFGLYTIEELADGRRLGQILALATLAEARGSGIGESMMNLLLDRLTAAGCFGVDSTALPGDRNTKNFFESFGLKARMLRVHKSLGD